MIVGKKTRDQSSAADLAFILFYRKPLPLYNHSFSNKTNLKFLLLLFSSTSKGDKDLNPSLLYVDIITGEIFYVPNLRQV